MLQGQKTLLQQVRSSGELWADRLSCKVSLGAVITEFYSRYALSEDTACIRGGGHDNDSFSAHSSGGNGLISSRCCGRYGKGHNGQSERPADRAADLWRPRGERDQWFAQWEHQRGRDFHRR